MRGAFSDRLGILSAVISDDARTGDTQRDDPGVFQRIDRRRRRIRARIAANTTVDLVYRISVAIVGTVVLCIGIIAIPYPGPGWLIVFTGLGILASEFSWARRVLKFVRRHYDRFMEWFSRQSKLVQAAGALLTTAVVIATLWLFGVFGLLGGWLGLDWSWLAGPL